MDSEFKWLCKCCLLFSMHITKMLIMVITDVRLVTFYKYGSLSDRVDDSSLVH